MTAAGVLRGPSIFRCVCFGMKVEQFHARELKAAAVVLILVTLMCARWVYLP